MSGAASPRFRMSPLVTAYLDLVFGKLGRTPYLSPGFAASLAAETGLSPHQVQVWFSNARSRRSKWKDERLNVSQKQIASGRRFVMVPRMTGLGAFPGEVHCTVGINQPTLVEPPQRRKRDRKRSRSKAENGRKKCRTEPTNAPEPVTPPPADSAPAEEAVPQSPLQAWADACADAAATLCSYPAHTCSEDDCLWGWRRSAWDDASWASIPGAPVRAMDAIWRCGEMLPPSGEFVLPDMIELV